MPHVEGTVLGSTLGKTWRRGLQMQFERPEHKKHGSSTAELTKRQYGGGIVNLGATYERALGGKGETNGT